MTEKVAVVMRACSERLRTGTKEPVSKKKNITYSPEAVGRRCRDN